MANQFKEQQQAKREADNAALVRACQDMANKCGRVQAVKKYRAETGVSLKVAQQELFDR